MVGLPPRSLKLHPLPCYMPLSYCTPSQCRHPQATPPAPYKVGLPRSLKLQLELAVHAPIFVRLPLFRLCSPAEILQLVQRLTPALAMPGEAIVKEGEDNLGLFFLMRGAVAVERRGRRVATMFATAAFGEQALLGGAEPTSSVVALRFCEITVRSNPNSSQSSVRSRCCCGTT